MYVTHGVKDISFMGIRRATVKAQLHTVYQNRDVLLQIAKEIREDEMEQWDEFTVFLYEPGKALELSAQHIIEFTNDEIRHITHVRGLHHI